MSLMLEARDVSKHYGDQCVLAPLDLRLERGKILVLLGQSGSGKSTLLRICMGLVTPTTGQVEFEGELMTAENAERLRLRMGYVIQDGGLFPHLTARDNVLLVARYLKREAEAAAHLDELIELTQLPAACLDRYPGQLSGGQRQRVSLLRALILRPKLLLLDEPLGALDPLIRSDLQNDLLRICRTLDQTVILVTHDLAEAQFFGDEICLMRDGAMVQRGPFNDLLTRPAEDFVSRFVQAQRGIAPAFV
jgi:osmoprotectant transport system ATP-binding protein